MFVLPNTPSKTIVDQLCEALKSDRFYLDGNMMDASTFRSLLLHMRQSGMRPIPTVKPNSSLEMFSVAKEFLPEHGSKLCIWMPADSCAKADCEHRLNSLMAAIGISPEEADILIDLATTPDSGVAIKALEHIPWFESWNNIWLSASSFPEHLTGAGQYEECQPGIHKLVLPRREITLFETINSAGFSREIGFSDRTVNPSVHKVDDESTKTKRRPTVNIRYTLPDSFLILKGIHKNGNQDMRRLCKALIKMDEFRGGSYSYGDAQYFKCAGGGKFAPADTGGSVTSIIT